MRCALAGCPKKVNYENQKINIANSFTTNKLKSEKRTHLKSL